MRKAISLLCLVAVVIVLYGCPYASPYNLDTEPTENIDESLLGKWATFVAKPGTDRYHPTEPVKVVISKHSDMEYDIAITGYLNELKPYHVLTNDSITGTAHLTALCGKRFMNAFIQGRVYIAEVITDGNGLSIRPLSEYFTARLIKSTQQLRTEVEFHYKMRKDPGYDPMFRLDSLKRVN